MQTQNHRSPLYRNTWHCLVTIAKQDSIRGLYRGMSSPMAGVAAVNAIAFGVFGNVQRMTGEPNSFKAHFLAGSAAGFCQSLVCSPMELIKTRLQLQSSNPAAIQFKSPFQCLMHIWRTERFRGVFRGLGITAARDVPGFSSYFVFYEMMTKSTPNPSALHTLMAGGMAGTLSWLLTFPIDIIKSQLQADGMTATQKYNGILDCAGKGYREEGIRFFTRGLTSTLIRAFPMNAVCFLVVSWTMKAAAASQSTDSLKLEYHQPEPLLAIGSMTTPLMVPPTRPQDHHSHAQHRHKTHTIRHFIFSSAAFHEAVCQDELSELAHDVYNDETSYYRWEGCPSSTVGEDDDKRDIRRRLLTD